jgi:glycosyltransferase involved in cell wall biosynthesis
MSNRIRVLHLGKFYPPVRGGIESFVADLATAQANMEIEPFVLAHQDKPLVPTSNERIGHVQVCRAAVATHIVYAPIAPGYPLLLRKVLNRFSPDVIHVHVPNLSPFWLLALRPKQPIILHWHADVVSSEIDQRIARSYRFYRPFERALLRLASAIIGTSEPYLENSPALKGFESKSHMVPIGLDPARLHRPDAGAIEKLREQWRGKFILLAAGRFAYYKGFDFLVEAVNGLSDIILIIAGDGPYRQKVMNQVHRLGLSDRITLPGAVSDQELHTMMAACDAFCLPSIERTEAFGITLLEAMCFGKPLISTAIKGSGTGWVNKNGETGIVVPPGDMDALRRAIEYIMSERKLCHEMGLKAYERFQSHFHIQDVARQVEALYHSTLQTPPTCG